MRLSQLTGSLQRILLQSIEAEGEMGLQPLHPESTAPIGGDPKIYISIGETCIPITMEAQEVSTVMGASNGLCISAKLSLPPELYNEWFQLQQKIMQHLRGSK